MARTDLGERLTEAHRLEQMAIQVGLARRLSELWSGVDATNLRGTLDPFAWGGESAVLHLRAVAADTAARYYASFRGVEKVPGTFPLRAAPEPPRGFVKDNLVASSYRGIRDARRRGLDVRQATDAGFAKATATATRIAADGARRTLLDGVLGDPEARGYQRVTDGDPCAFCRMIASRGVVAYTSESVSFKAHDGCGCTAEPAFAGSRASPRNAAFKREWDEATGGRSGADALNAYRRSLAGRGG